ISSRLSGASALRLLKVESFGNPIFSPSSSRFTGRAPSKVAAKAGLVSPSLWTTAGQVLTISSKVRASWPAGPVATSGGPAGGGCASVPGPPESAPPAGGSSSVDGSDSAVLGTSGAGSGSCSLAGAAPAAGGAVGGTAPEEASATGGGGGSPAATGPATG